jgi:uncharacterized protein (DUF1501 family)
MRHRKAAVDPSRREFMWQSACAAVGAAAMATTVWDMRMIQAATAANLAAATTDNDYRAMVCLFLYGGNDANNLIVPTSSTEYGQYAAARGMLALPKESLLALNPLVGDGRTYGLHSACPELQALFNTGKLAMINNVGTLVGPITRAQYLAKSAAVPPSLFSHNDQQVQWQTSVPDQISRTGWAGRCADIKDYLNSVSSNGAKVSMNISLAGSNVIEVGNLVSPYKVSTGGAISPNIPGGATAPQLQALKDLIALEHVNLMEKSVANTTTNAIRSGETINSAIAATRDSGSPAPPPWTWSTPFPTTSLGSQLKMIARLIAGRAALGHKRQLFFAAVSGYDLHGEQLAPHANLLTDLSKSVNAFYKATVQLNVPNDVCLFTVSDFGRTFPVNGGAGSDHGWGNHQFVVGGGVQGQRLYGNFPTLAVNGPDDTNTGRWIPTTAVDEYSATLAKWFGVSTAEMPTVFPNIHRFAQPDLGFMG